MTADANGQRAANGPRPAFWNEPAGAQATEHDFATANFLATSAANYYTDTSQYQEVYTSAYPYPIAAFRFHNGSSTDPKAKANWAYHREAIAQGRTRVVIAYSVFRPGALTSALASLHEVFGTTSPTKRLIIMEDMESGAQFAGPGNHSAEANVWANNFAAYVGSWARVMAYANAPDYAQCWPQIDSRLLAHRNVARYDDNPPTISHYAQQYYGGIPGSPHPVGAPVSCAPFGAFVDLNVIYRTIEQIELDFGITTPAPPAPPAPPALVAYDEEDTMPRQIWFNTTPTGTPGCFLVYDNGVMVGENGGTSPGLLQGPKAPAGSYPVYPGYIQINNAATPVNYTTFSAMKAVSDILLSPIPEAATPETPES